MELKKTVVSVLIVLGLLTVGYGIISWIFSLLNRIEMPIEAYLIVVGILTVVFAMIAARMFSGE